MVQPAKRRWVAYGLAGYFLLGAGGVLFYSKVGKLALRERLLDKIPWRGDERVLDMGCGRGLLAVGAAHRGSSGTVTGVDMSNRHAVRDNRACSVLENAAIERAQAAWQRKKVTLGSFPLPTVPSTWWCRTSWFMS